MPDLSVLQQRLASRRAEHLYRTRAIVDGPQSIHLRIDGKDYLNFCSNDYLGLASHPKLIESLQQAASRFGVGSGAAHLINGHSRAHHELEEQLASFTGRPRALLFSTGYMANLGVISALFKQGDRVLEDRYNHASLLDGGLLSGARLQRYRHLDSEDVSHKLSQVKSGQKLVVSDGVFSMDGDVAPVQQLASVCQQHDAWLMIDDAHGLGVIGKQGGGIIEQARLTTGDVPILVGTLGKAFGTFGAFVAAEAPLIETLIQQARSYIYTTAIPSAIAAATLTSLQLVQEEAWRREHLQDLIVYFRRQAHTQDIPLTESATAIQPVVIGDVERTLQLSAVLKQAGLLISAIRPPTVPEGSARLRITLSAAHTQTHIDQLVETLANALRQVGHGDS